MTSVIIPTPDDKSITTSEDKSILITPFKNKGCKSRYSHKHETFITSYGIILFTIQGNRVLYQLCKPRDSVNYVSFIRGLYSKKQLKFFLALMTEKEIERITMYPFDKLWDDLWFGAECKFAYMEYRKAKRTFRENYRMVVDMIADIDHPHSDSHLWGFPKGKKNSNEKSIETAVREFEEETMIGSSQINIVSEIPLIESYYGSNDKLYKTVYYPAFTPHIIASEYTFKNSELRTDTSLIVSNEIEDLGWFTYEEVMEKFTFRPYRQRMVTILHKCILDQIKTGDNTTTTTIPL